MKYLVFYTSLELESISTKQVIPSSQIYCVNGMMFAMCPNPFLPFHIKLFNFQKGEDRTINHLFRIYNYGFLSQKWLKSMDILKVQTFTMHDYISLPSPFRPVFGISLHCLPQCLLTRHCLKYVLNVSGISASLMRWI